MSEYWKSTNKYWCKHCSVFVRDTKLERTNHEATAKHQGAVKRSLRDLHRNADNKEREKERAKREVERLNGVVSGSASSSASGASRSGAKASSGVYGAPPQQVSEVERQKQLEQLAELGVNIPTELRGSMAMPGEWTVTATKVIEPSGGKAYVHDSDSTKKEEGELPNKAEDSQGETVENEGVEPIKQEPSPPIKNEPDDEETSSSTTPVAIKMSSKTVKFCMMLFFRGYLRQRNEEYKALRDAWLNGTTNFLHAPPMWPADRCMLIRLPAELLLMICEPLYQAGLFHLALTCRVLAGVTLDLLYQRDILLFDCLALRWACTFGIVSTLQRTISYGAPPDRVCNPHSHVGRGWIIGGRTDSWPYDPRYCETPLSTAIVANEPEIVRLLLAHGADPNHCLDLRASDRLYSVEDCLFPINLAMGTPQMRSYGTFMPGHPRIVRQFLDAGANPNQYTVPRSPLFTGARVRGFTPLHMAMQAKVPVETVKLLLERGADPTLIQLLLSYGGAHEVYHVSYRPVGNGVGSLLPVLFRHWNHPWVADVLKLFISEGADITSWGAMLIPAIVSLMLWTEEFITEGYRRAAVHQVSEALAKACEVITLMAEATLVEEHTGPVRKSAIIDAVISAEVPGPWATREDQSALRYVCGYFGIEGFSWLVPVLLRYGADMNSADTEGRTALHHAAMFASGLIVDACDSWNWTPLHYACLFGMWGESGNRVATARLFLDNGADSRARTNGDWTPLSLAVLSANRDLVELLLDHGAHPEDAFRRRESDTEMTWCLSLAIAKEGTATLLSHRTGIPVRLAPAPELPILPGVSWLQHDGFEIDVVYPCFGTSSVDVADLGGTKFEEDIENVLDRLDLLGLEAWIASVRDSVRPSMFWRGGLLPR
ncbi:ankyrin [Parathielavia appendiculata]|uniref:Ankyrin n=1 Tax=Parathielavia appendiculata TaxID=2587402 RepID=A0AAN6Z823_9PEZI|nr:ankyrin [Parathielavia appendiculata]